MEEWIKNNKLTFSMIVVVILLSLILSSVALVKAIDANDMISNIIQKSDIPPKTPPGSGNPPKTPPGSGNPLVKPPGSGNPIVKPPGSGNPLVNPPGFVGFDNASLGPPWTWGTGNSTNPDAGESEHSGTIQHNSSTAYGKYAQASNDGVAFTRS